MRGEIRRKIEMASRVRELCRANPSTEEGYESAVTRLEERLARADALGIQQRTGTGDARAASARRRQTRFQIEFALLNPLVKVGRSAARANPELIGKFQLSHHHATHKAFLIGARTMLGEATTAKEVLLKQGLAAAPRRPGQGARPVRGGGQRHQPEPPGLHRARVELGEVAANLSELVQVLDAFNRYRFQADPEQLAVWNAARSVVGHTPRSRTPAPPPSPGPTDGSTRAA